MVCFHLFPFLITEWDDSLVVQWFSQVLDVDVKALSSACVQPCWVVLNDDRTLQCYENVKLRLGRPRLVGGACDMIFVSISWVCHHPNWRTHIFQRGKYTTNQQDTRIGVSTMDKWWLILMVILPPMNIAESSSYLVKTKLPTSYFAGSWSIYSKVRMTLIFIIGW